MLRMDRGLRAAGLIGTLLIVLPSILIMGGCPHPEVGFDSPDPNKRVDAIVLAAQEDDQASRELLVEKLGSTDPAERMMAIRALEKREGTTLGYEHAASATDRLVSIEKWRKHIGLSDAGGDDEDSPMSLEKNDAGNGQP